MSSEESTPADATPGLWDHISGARWFSGKGRGGRLSGVVPLDWFRAPGPGVVPVRPEIAEVTYPDGSSEHYQLLVSYRDRPGEAPIDPAPVPGLGWRQDAVRDPAAMNALVGALLANRDSPTWRVTLNDALSGDLTPRPFSGQQSNTNVLLGDRALLKIFRKLEPGHNLDIEVHDALGSAGVRSIAALHGWVSGILPGRPGVSFDLMMVVEQLRDAEDGWELACARVRENRDFTADAAHLGSALRRVHDALREAFPTTTLDGTQIASAMAERLDAAVAGAPDLRRYREPLADLFGSLRGLRIPAQRIHGDFHLGQTLRVGEGETGNPWRIIDFEGEPMRTMSQRRLPDSPWRDVAGMARSLGYATSAHPQPDGAEASAWLTASRAAFLDAYAGDLTDRRQAVLLAYEADKAAYETLYEARNRPDWIHIPLAGIARIVERSGG